MTYRSYRHSLGRLLAVALGLLILAVTLVFSLVIFSILLAAALLLLGYAWWRIRSSPIQKHRTIDAEAHPKGFPTRRETK
jgi:hypothetical protein